MSFTHEYVAKLAGMPVGDVQALIDAADRGEAEWFSVISERNGVWRQMLESYWFARAYRHLSTERLYPDSPPTSGVVTVKVPAPRGTTMHAIFDEASDKQFDRVIDAIRTRGNAQNQ